MKKKVGIIKRVLCLCLVFLLSINSFAAILSDNDGSAFITKAEFDALKQSFQSQIDSYNQSIDSKIDGAIASYLAGIQLATTKTEQLLHTTFGDVECLIVDGTGKIEDQIQNCNINVRVHRDYNNSGSTRAGFIQEYDYNGVAGSNTRCLVQNIRDRGGVNYGDWVGYAGDWKENWSFITIESKPGVTPSSTVKKTVGTMGYMPYDARAPLVTITANHKDANVRVDMCDSTKGSIGGGYSKYLLDSYSYTATKKYAIVFNPNVAKDFINLGDEYGFGLGPTTATAGTWYNAPSSQLLWYMDNVGQANNVYLQIAGGTNYGNKGYWPGRAYDTKIVSWAQLINPQLGPYQDTNTTTFPGVTLYNGLPIFKVINPDASYQLSLDTTATPTSKLYLYMGYSSFDASNNRLPVRLSKDGTTWADYITLDSQVSTIRLHPDDIKLANGKYLWIKWCSTDATINGGGTVHLGSNDSYMNITSA